MLIRQDCRTGASNNFCGPFVRTPGALVYRTAEGDAAARHWQRLRDAASGAAGAGLWPPANGGATAWRRRCLCGRFRSTRARFRWRPAIADAVRGKMEAAFWKGYQDAQQKVNNLQGK